MSEDGFSDPYDEPGMDLIIETLTGTSFEMRVYPTDTVLDIKNKIHRVEGIPVHHQNLLFQMKELQDYIRLCDAGIVSGSSLKLVLSMRGGPISTRRLSTCDHHVIWKDLKELIEHTRDEIGDKSGSKVSVLVFKEGEVLNVIRVIENDDGTYSPYADKAVSPPYARYKEKEDLQQTFFKKITEDMEMATKMHVLRAKMKKLRQQRKTSEKTNKSTSDNNNSAFVNSGGGGGDFNVGKKGNNGDFNVSNASVSGGDFIEIELPSASVTGDSSNGDYKMIESLISVQENIDNPLENLEIALKEKHRTRVRGGDAVERKESTYFCKNLHVFEPDKKEEGVEKQKKKSSTSNSILSPLYNRYSSDSGARHRRTSQLSFEEGGDTRRTCNLNLEDGEGRKIGHLGCEDGGEELKHGRRVSHLSFEDGGEELKHRRFSHLNFEDGGEELKHRRFSHLNFEDGGDEFQKHGRRVSHLSFEDGGEELKQEEGACAETLSLAARNRVHLTRLVIQDSGETRGKSSPDSIELEENSSSEMWEIQPETIKSSGAYKVGLVKRRSSVDHNFDGDFGLEGSASNLNLEREDFNQNSEYEVFGRNFYHVPQFISTPSAIPPQYVPKDERICDLYLGSPVSDTKIRRSPLYGRRSKNDFNLFTEEEKKPQNSSSNSTQFLPKLHTKNENNFTELASNIERLQNDYTELDYEDFDSINYTDDMFNYYSSTCTSDLDKLLHPRFKEPSNWTDVKSDDAQLANEIKRLSFDIKIDDSKSSKVQIEDLPAVVSKKRMRCGHCNKRLNITNIYNCRCGRIFCSQHRYSESHDCKYDYKSEGRKLLEQQNPLVTATKLTKF